MSRDEIKVLRIKPVMTDEQAEAISGTLLGDHDFKMLIDYDADVYDEETGACIAKFRKGVIPQEMVIESFKALRKAATPTTNRGVGAGRDEKTNKARSRAIKKDGTISNTNYAPAVNSGIIGYFDRNPRFPYCRTTAFNEKEFSKFKKAYPIIRFVSEKFKQLVPERYEAQKRMIDKTNPEFVIKDTVFTTVTVNKNWQTAVHTDKGDLEEGFGNLVALRKGIYAGGYFVVVKWGVAFDIQNQDVLFVDVHQWHGNTPIHPEPGAERLSLVMYYRKKMVECGTVNEELDRARRLVDVRHSSVQVE